MASSKKKKTAEKKSNKKAVGTKAANYKSKVTDKVSTGQNTGPSSKKTGKPKSKSGKPTSKQDKSKPKSKVDGASGKPPSSKKAKGNAKGEAKGDAASSAPPPPKENKVGAPGRENSQPKGINREMFENRLFQQRLPTCTPLLTVGSAIPYFALFFVGFFLIGGLLWFTQQYAIEYKFDYTNCYEEKTGLPCYEKINVSRWRMTHGNHSNHSTMAHTGRSHFTHRAASTHPSKHPSKHPSTYPSTYPSTFSGAHTSTSSPSNESSTHSFSGGTRAHYPMHEHHPPKEACICETIIKVERSIPWNVFLYYSIDQLYQNYLPYSGSIDPKQQYGHRNASKSECGNFTTINVTRHGHRPVPTPIAPCGMLANSFFNDTIELFLIFTHPKRDTLHLVPVPLHTTDITWTPDYAVKNPPTPKHCPAHMSSLECAFNGTIRPPNWNRSLWELDPGRPENNGYRNEMLQSWLRPAPFTPFRKLYGRVDHKQILSVPNRIAAEHFFGSMLPNGSYLLKVTYNFPVKGFEGKKTVILSNMTWMGGKSTFLAYLYLMTSCICFILLIIFVIVDRKFGQISKEVYSFVDNRSNLRLHQRATRLLEKAKNSTSKAAKNA